VNHARVRRRIARRFDFFSIRGGGGGCEERFFALVDSFVSNATAGTMMATRCDEDDTYRKW